MKKNIIIRDEAGFHARPASSFAQKASDFESEIKIIKNEREANGKSVMSLMSLGVTNGDEITLKVEGSDSKKAFETLIDLIEREFNE